MRVDRLSIRRVTLVTPVQRPYDSSSNIALIKIMDKQLTQLSQLGDRKGRCAYSVSNDVEGNYPMSWDY